MRLVTAVIRPHALQPVQEAMNRLGVLGLTVTEVIGYGRQKGHTEVYRGAEYQVDMIPKLRLEMLTDDVFVERVIDALVGATHTGTIGDGKIWVTPVEDVIRLRTGERGADAV